nr:hypothetical protein [Tanacetum cinerariifolium]
MQTHTSNTLHNAIMEAGGKARPPMLAPGNYVQWKSRIKRYIDTKHNHELIHYCLKNPRYKFTWADKVVSISKGSPETITKRYMETYKNVSQDIHDQLNAEAEAVQIILSGIDNDIYSTVDACPNACEMWKSIERLKQGESINVQDLETKLYWEFRKFTSRDGGSLESYYSRSQQAATRNREKAIVNSHPPIYDQEPSMVAEDDEIDAEYNNQRLGNVAGARETVAYHREKMLLCKQEEVGIQLNAEQADWRDDTDDESEAQELEAHYMYMAQIQEVSLDVADSGPIFEYEPLQKVSNDDYYNVFAIKSEHPEQSKYVHDTYPIEQDEHNVIIDSLDMSYDKEQIDQNDDDNLANERDLLASLIEKLKCEIDDSKNRNKFLETSNKVLVEKLKGEIKDFKNKNKSLESSKNCFKEANNKLLETNKLMYTDLKKFQPELDKRNDVKNEKKLSAHQETISILSQVKEAQIKLYKTREYKELDKVIALENKVKNVSQDIRDQLNAKAEAIQIILTGIDNDIYSTVDACPNACEMWKAIERSQQAATGNRSKAIVNSHPPIYDQEPTIVTEDDEMSKDKEIDKLMALISLSFKKIYEPTNNNLQTSSNNSRVNQDNSLRINRGTGYENQRIVNVALAREECRYTGEQADWRDDTNDEPDDQELEAHYMYMAQIQEVTPDAADNSCNAPLRKEDVMS